jgi:hypothetical protein
MRLGLGCVGPGRSMCLCWGLEGVLRLRVVEAEAVGLLVVGIEEGVLIGSWLEV